MNKLFVSIIVLFLNCSLVGQSKKAHVEVESKWSFGVNTNIILTSLFKIEDNKIYNPYIIDIRRILTPKSFITLGIGGHNDNKVNQLDGFADKTFFDDWSISIRLGYGMEKDLNLFWKVDYGIHLVSEMFANNTIQDSGFDKVSDINQGFSVGGGPFLSFTYRIIDKISLRSESAFYYLRGQTNIAKTFETVPESSDLGNRLITNSIKTYLPVNIFLTYHF